MKTYYSDILKRLVTIPEDAGDDPQLVADLNDDDGLPFRVVAVCYLGKEGKE